MPHFEKQENLYALKCGQEIYLMDKVGICFTYSDVGEEYVAVLHKIGDIKYVSKAYNDLAAVFPNDTHYVISSTIEVEELNKMLDICDYVGKWWKNNKDL